MEVTVKKIKRFLMFKLPSAYLCGVRLQEIDASKSIVTVKYKWINQNPFNSMYFAVQSMAAELTTGAIVIKKIGEERGWDKNNYLEMQFGWEFQRNHGM